MPNNCENMPKKIKSITWNGVTYTAPEWTFKVQDDGYIRVSAHPQLIHWFPLEGCEVEYEEKLNHYAQ